MNITIEVKDVEPTIYEENLAEKLCKEYYRYLYDRKIEWSGSLYITHNERQVWYRLARKAIMEVNEQIKWED